MNTLLHSLLNRPNWIFDLDGVVVDTSDLHARAFKETFSSIGIEFNDYDSISGMSTYTAVTTVLSRQKKDYSDDLIEDLVNNKQTLALNLISSGFGVELLPYVDMVLNKIHETGKSVALVSSASGERVKLIFELLKIEKFFRYVVTADDVKNGKPDPEPFNVAKTMIGDQNINNYLVFEDSQSGIVSATTAQMKVIGVSQENRELPGSDYTISSFQEVLDLL